MFDSTILYGKIFRRVVLLAQLARLAQPCAPCAALRALRTCANSLKQPYVALQSRLQPRTGLYSLTQPFEGPYVALHNHLKDPIIALHRPLY